MITRISSVIRPKGSDLIFDHPYNAEYLLLSSMRTARLGGIQITLFCRVTQPASHRVAGDRMRDVDDRDDGVGALAL